MNPDLKYLLEEIENKFTGVASDLLIQNIKSITIRLFDFHKVPMDNISIDNYSYQDWDGGEYFITITIEKIDQLDFKQIFIETCEDGHQIVINHYKSLVDDIDWYSDELTAGKDFQTVIDYVYQTTDVEKLFNNENLTVIESWI